MAEPEEQGMKSAGWRLWLMLLLLLSSTGSAWFIHDWRLFSSRPLPLDEADILLVNRGSSVSALSEQLAERFHQPLSYWLLLYRLHGGNRPIQAGEYRLQPGTTPRGLLEMLLAGDVLQHRFRIQEGWTWKQLQQALSREERLLYDLSETGLQQLQQQLAPARSSLEGLFFPDTYRFQRNSPASELLMRAGRLMQVRLQRAWNTRDRELTSVLETPYEALILASIVEKETALAVEMPRIAGVFLNRLRRNMRLQTDPTVIYGMGDAFDGNIRRKDLKTPTPWNTYVIHGLPPTPICMPGEAALRAVTRPEQHDFLYFVADGSGGHHFSRTYEEHRRAVRRYQLKGKP